MKEKFLKGITGFTVLLFLMSTGIRLDDGNGFGVALTIMVVSAAVIAYMNFKHPEILNPDERRQ